MLILLGILVLVIILAINHALAQVYENQSVICVPNLNSNKSSDLQCDLSSKNSTSQTNSTQFFLNHSNNNTKS